MLINPEVGGNGGARRGVHRGRGAADAAVTPEVRKKGMMDTSDRPVRKFRGRIGGGRPVGTLRSPFVTVSLKWIQGGQDFWRTRKERSYCERWLAVSVEV